MRIVLAPDSFKGSLSALAACRDAVIEDIPLGDGGQSTMDCLVQATVGRVLTTEAVNPLGLPFQAHYAILGDGRTAVVECAEAAGLTLIPESERNPGITTTFGVGQLMLAALEPGSWHEASTL